MDLPFPDWQQASGLRFGPDTGAAANRSLIEVYRRPFIHPKNDRRIAPVTMWQYQVTLSDPNNDVFQVVPGFYWDTCYLSVGDADGVRIRGRFDVAGDPGQNNAGVIKYPVPSNELDHFHWSGGRYQFARIVAPYGNTPIYFHTKGKSGSNPVTIKVTFFNLGRKAQYGADFGLGVCHCADTDPQPFTCTGYVVCDRFNRPDSLPGSPGKADTGQQWKAYNLSAMGAIVGNRLRFDGSTGAGILHFDTDRPLISDVSIEIGSVDRGIGVGWPGISYRYQDAFNRYFAMSDLIGGISYWCLFKVKANVITRIGQPAAGNAVSANGDKLRVEAYKDRHALFVNDRLACYAIDADFQTANYHGVICNSSANTIDDFRIKELV